MLKMFVNYLVLFLVQVIKSCLQNCIRQFSFHNSLFLHSIFNKSGCIVMVDMGKTIYLDILISGPCEDPQLSNVSAQWVTGTFS